MCAYAFWPRAVEKMSDQGIIRQSSWSGYPSAQATEKEKQELTEMLTKASLA